MGEGGGGLIFTYQPTIFQLCRDWSSRVEPILSKEMCLAQGQKAVKPVRL